MVYPLLLALVLSLCCAASPPVQAQTHRFNHLSVNEGLSHDKVLSLLQDHQGFMWFGTEDGLNRYDGYTFSVFQNVPFDSTSLPGDIVYALYEDRVGVLWIGTNKGLSRLDRATGTFTNFLPERDAPHTPWTNDVGYLYEDHTGTFWVGTFGGGLYQMDRTADTLTPYRHDPDDPGSLSFDVVEAIHEDHSGILWVATINGLNRFDRASGTFTRFLYPEDDLFNGSIVDFAEDAREPGVFWLTTITGLVRFVPATGALERILSFPYDTTLQNGPWWSMPQGMIADPTASEVLWIVVPRKGLYRFDTATRQAQLYRHDHDASHSLSGEPQCVYVDPTGMIWIGTARGIDRFDPTTSRFAHHVAGEGDTPPLLHRNVSALYEDRSGNRWVGTGDFLVGTALTRIDRSDGTVTHWQPPPGIPAGLPDNISINVLYEDRDGFLWIGTTPRNDEAALLRLDPRTAAFTAWQHDPDDDRSLGPGGVTALLEDRTGTFWIGTTKGFSRLDRTTGTFVHDRHEDAHTPRSLSASYVRALYEDQTGSLWIGTAEGLIRWNPTTETFTRYRHEAGNPHSLGDRSVFALHEHQGGKPGVLWVSTGTTLDRFDTRNGTFTHYSDEDGLPPYPIVGILEGETGQLWMSTSGAGLLRFEPSTGAVRRYDETNDVQGRRFNLGAAFRSPRTGAMYFGGTNGYNAFHPAHMRRSSNPPPVVFTDFKLFGRSVLPGPSSPLRQPIWETQQIRLPHTQNSLSFDFVALHYTNPAKNRYAYWLDGFDAGWIAAGDRRTATYTNLNPGTYVFRVKAANSEGVWNEHGVAVQLVILPPWWHTWWAYMLYGALLLGAIITADRFRQWQVLREERAKSLLLEKDLRAEIAEAWASYLQAENERQVQELENARALQLSMLPKAVPDHPVVELAAYMKTATEVGGDYYDFAVADDGTLTVVVGDATGHGAQAGVMVTAAKSLFTGFADEPDLVRILQRSAAAIRKIGVPKLFMTMALARVRGDVLELAGAGMPPALVFRAATGCIEEVPLKGIPLGGPGRLTYPTHRMPLSPGDTIVLMSDGFAESFREDGTMMGYERMAEVFATVAGAPPDAVVAHFRNTLATWRGGRAPNDDVTFVVMRIKD